MVPLWLLSYPRPPACCCFSSLLPTCFFPLTSLLDTLAAEFGALPQPSLFGPPFGSGAPPQPCRVLEGPEGPGSAGCRQALGSSLGRVSAYIAGDAARGNTLYDGLGSPCSRPPTSSRPLHLPSRSAAVTAPTGVPGPFAFTDGSLAVVGRWNKHASQVQSTISCWHQEVRKKWPKWGKVGPKIWLTFHLVLWPSLVPI